MDTIILLIVLVVGIILILPWVNAVKLMHRKEELRKLEEDLSRLRKEVLDEKAKRIARDRGLDQPISRPPVEAKIREPKMSEQPAAPTESWAARTLPPTPSTGELSEFELVQPTKTSEQIKPKAAPTLRKDPQEIPEMAKESERKTQDWFGKITVWIGGVALLMAGFYMIKYSIDSGWLTPAVRTWMTTIFGLILSGGGYFISKRTILAANEKVGQALSGAGVACLYFAAYAAVHIYSFIEPGAGFFCMAAVTVLAIFLSLSNGAPIALIGLLGGYLTPWLMQTGSSDTVSLLGYLFLLYCGAQFLCLRRGWFGLWLLSTLAAYIWTIGLVGWLWSGRIAQIDGLMWFLLGICSVNGIWVLLASRENLSKTDKMCVSLLRAIVWGGGILQSLIIAWIGGFAAVDMAFFAVLSMSALCMSVLKEEEFKWASWLGLGALIATTLAHSVTQSSTWIWWPIGLSLVYAGVGHWRSLVSDSFLKWRALTMSALIWLAPVLYLNRIYIIGDDNWFSGSWMLISGISALLLALAGEHLLKQCADGETTVGEYQTFSVFLLAFGFWTWVPHEYSAHAFSSLIIITAIYWKRRGFLRAELVLGTLASVWSLIILPAAGIVLSYFFRHYGLISPELSGTPFLAFVLGAAAACSLLVLFADRWHELDCSKLVKGWTGLSLLFAFVASYQMIDQHWMPTAWSRAATEGGLTTLLAFSALIILLKGHRLADASKVTFTLALLAVIRIVWLHLLDNGAAGESFFNNALLWQFGFPFFCLCALAWFSAEADEKRSRTIYQTVAMIVGFIWATFLIQDYFGGSRLFEFRSTNSELYTYSVVWLVLGISYQAIGLWRAQKAIHIGSLILLLLTVTKVFLVDASELEGLFRVLSFLGLGMALIGIGFFYNKVVFARSHNSQS